ncbi:MAG: DNA topoisomerase I, partial [bacterium]|nr:DNA topoisomerase I [bacterium]
VRGFIGPRYGNEYLPDAPNVYKSKKSAQEAHEAIRPTDVTIEPASVKDHMDKDMFNLYGLIWSRFVSCQMVPAILDTTQFDIRCGDNIFRANGSIIKFRGFLQVYEESKEETITNDKKSDSDRLLPPLEKGDVLKLQEIKPEQHFTQPPPRYSEAMLVKALEEKGIGRPSTYAAIISVIKDRDYIRNLEGRLRPSELGFLVTELLVE